MARPYFTGNYGSPLMSNQAAAMLVADQGAKTGQMYAQMGKDIGGVVKQYGLNKEKRRKEEDTAIGALAGFTPEELMQIGQDNPKLGKAIERAPTEGATPRDFQIINASLAPIVAGKARRLAEARQETQNKLGEQNLGLRERLEDSQVKNAELRNVYQGLANDLTKLSKDRTEAIQGNEITAILDKFADDAGLRQFRSEVAGEKLIQQGAALRADPLADQVDRQRRQQLQALKGDKLAQKLNKQQLKSLKQGAEMFEAMGGVTGQVKRLEEDRELQKLQALGLYHARTNIGQSSPATVPMQKILSEAQKELERMGSLTTTLTDDDDKSLSVIDLLEVKPNREIGLKEGYDLTKMDDVTRDNVQLFLTQSGKVQDAQKQMPVPIQGTVSLTNFGSEPPKVGEIIDFNGQEARVVDITGGVVTVQYEGTLYEKNLQDIEALQREEAARVDAPRFSPSEHIQNTYGM